MKREIIRRWSKILAVACVFYVIGNLYQPTVVVGNSMAPTLDDGKLIWVDRTYYKTHAPQRGEVVVIKHDGEYLVKRIYRTGGETLYYTASGSEWLGPIREDRIDQARETYSRLHTVLSVKSTVVPADSVFVLGDNFSCSIDSRQLGAIPVSEIIGRAHLEADKTVMLPWEYMPKLRRGHQRTVAIQPETDRNVALAAARW